jgi:hypothetical protein
MNVGDTNVPFIVIDDANNWESGLYTITSSTVVTRTQILNSSNGGVARGSAARTRRRCRRIAASC